LSTNLQSDDDLIHNSPHLPTEIQFRYQWSPLSSRKKAWKPHKHWV